MKTLTQQLLQVMELYRLLGVHTYFSNLNAIWFSIYDFDPRKHCQLFTMFKSYYAFTELEVILGRAWLWWLALGKDYLILSYLECVFFRGFILSRFRIKGCFYSAIVYLMFHLRRFRLENTIRGDCEYFRDLSHYWLPPGVKNDGEYCINRKMPFFLHCLL